MAHYETSSTSIEQLPFDTTTMNHGIPARSPLGDERSRRADWRERPVAIPQPCASLLHVGGRQEQDRAAAKTSPPARLSTLRI